MNFARRGKRPRPNANRPNGRTVTVRDLILRAIAERGLTPTDEELARTLAISVVRVRHHRQLLGM